MSARIQRNFIFQAGAYFEGRFYMNMYDVDVFFSVETSSIREQNIALDRMKFFLAETVSNSIFVQDTEESTIEKYLLADLKVCTLPEEPYDQIIGIMLMSKLNAIAEGRLLVTDISITSEMSDGVTVSHSFDENMGPFADDGWWNDSSTRISGIKSGKKSTKIVKLIKPNVDWADIYLNWGNEKEVIVPATEVVFANFDSKNKK
jgi:hypothetical protein